MLFFYVFHLKEEILCMPRGKSENLLVTSQQFKHTELTCTAVLTSLHTAVTAHQKLLRARCWKVQIHRYFRSLAHLSQLYAWLQCFCPYRGAADL